MTLHETSSGNALSPWMCSPPSYVQEIRASCGKTTLRGHHRPVTRVFPDVRQHWTRIIPTSLTGIDYLCYDLMGALEPGSLNRWDGSYPICGFALTDKTRLYKPTLEKCMAIALLPNKSLHCHAWYGALLLYMSQATCSRLQVVTAGSRDACTPGKSVDQIRRCSICSFSRPGFKSHPCSSTVGEWL